MYCIKRTYNRHGDHDYLTDFDPQWVTVCAGYRSPNIIKYPTQAEAQKVVDGFASRYAEKFPDCPEHKFEAVPFPPVEVAKKTNGGHTDDEVATAIRDYERENDL